MKRMISLLALVIAITMSASASDITRNVTVPSDCNALDISSMFDVTLTQSSSNSCKVIIDEKYEPYLVAKVENGKLILKMKDMPKMPMSINKGKWGKSHKMKAFITLKNLERMDISGMVNIESSGVFDVSNFKANISGMSDIEGLCLEGNKISMNISGSSDVEVKSKVDESYFNISGMSDFEEKGEARKARYDVSGSSDAEVFGKFSELSLSCSGMSDLEIKGEADNVKMNCSGSSEIKALSLNAKYAEVSASGMSDIEVNVTKGITINEASGSSDISYRAPQGVNAEIHSISGMSDVDRL